MGVSGVKGMYGEYGVAGTPAERSGWEWAVRCEGRSRTVALMVERGRSRSEAVRVRKGRCECECRVDDRGGFVVGVVLPETGVGPRAAWVRSGRASGAGCRHV